MQLLNYKNNGDQLEFIHNEFPFSFSNGYSKFTETPTEAFFILKNDTALAPVVIKTNKFFKTLRFHFKPLGIDTRTLNQTEEKAFLNECCKFIEKHNLAHRIVQPTNFALFSAYPDNSIHSLYGSYVIDLKSNTEEQLLQNMQARYRTALRATKKLEPEIRTGIHELASFWQLHKNTMDRTSMYVESLTALEKLAGTSPESVLVANCYLNGEIQGGIYIAYSKYGAYYLHGASSHTTLSDGAIKFLHYWCMCRLKEAGAHFYDFVGTRLSNIEGTKLEGIQNFKKRFGSELKQGYLWKKDISPIVCKAYDSLLLLKLSLKRIKVPQDIIDQEKHKLNER